ncbi:MAG TPA: tetratricopeptide repeat protein [bacterium]
MVLPAGTVTFVFTDIEGSTDLVRRLGDEAYAAVLAEHQTLVRTAVQAHGGHEVDTQGDSFFVAFESAASALAAAVEIQRVLIDHRWPEGSPVRVRIGLHTGEPVVAAGGYVGLDVNRAARISAVGYGGQILLSQTTRTLAGRSLPQDARLVDLGEHRLKDLQKPERIYQLVQPGLPADFPPIRSLSAVRNNLPLQLTSFIGREREIEEVKALLTKHRLLTLTGPGGSGKTRLAVQVAADVVDGFTDGIWVVELASLTDGALVRQAALTALGLREEQGSRQHDVLIDFLRDRRALIVMDNCEHLLHTCAELADALLQAAPSLSILATSRERLGIAGEVVFAVPTLSLPASGDIHSLAELRSSEAATLFLDRALLGRPTITFSDEAAGPVARIVRQLDGIPLAIELAAAKLKVLSLSQIVERLDNTFRLLTGGSRMAPSRQQTLQAAMDWSYDLLNEEERALLRRVAVFSGGFTLQAAEGIGGGTKGPGSVLDLLTSLVDKSLVIVDHEADDVRYRLLETVRGYAERRLSEAGEAPEMRARHARWFMEWTQGLEPRLFGLDEHVLNRVEREHDNIRAALAYLLQSADRDGALRLANAAFRFWEVRGHWSEGRQWLEAALPDSPADGERDGRALVHIGTLAQYQGDYARARDAAGRALRVFEDAGDIRGVSRAQNILGNVAYYQGDWTEAEQRYKMSLERARHSGEPRDRAGPLANLANIAFHHEAYDEAEQYARESLAAFEATSDRHGRAFVLNLLGLLAEEQDDAGRAQGLFEEGLAIRRILGDRRGIAGSLMNLGRVARAQHAFDRAEALYEESLTIRRELADAFGIAGALASLGEVALLRGDHVRAVTLTRESLTLRTEMGDRVGSIECLELLARSTTDLPAAASLLAAGAAARQAAGAPYRPMERRMVDERVGSVKGALPTAAFTAAWNAGTAMTLDEARKYALNVLP